MALDHTGMIIGERNSALIISPQSAFVVCANCFRGCGQVFYVAGRTWVDDVDCATIFRNEDAAEIAKGEARSNATGCLKDQGVTFDAMPLAGFVSK